ncbi:hypothetical protein N7512_005912 [Penicillium capsulatum]|nr:hypothetical protein N7512_005912 [Penicillium capsulatum]
MNNQSLISLTSEEDVLGSALATDQVEFPSLVPLSLTAVKMSAIPDPVIREPAKVVPTAPRAMIDLINKAAAIIIPVPPSAKAPVKTPPKTPTKSGSSPQSKKTNVVAGKGKAGPAKWSPRGRSRKWPGRVYTPPKKVAAPAGSKPFQLHWTFPTGSVFDSVEEERGATRFFGGVFPPNAIHDNAFFQWGLRFVPSVLSGFDNTHRTVTIDHLPPNISLERILPRVRGGAIYSANLLDTRNLVNSYTAFIVFVHQSGALAFLRRVAQEGFYLGSWSAKVHPVPTPTFPIGAETERQITRLGRSRVVMVSSPRERLRKNVYNVLVRGPCGWYIENFGENDEPGQVTVRFISIQMAQIAFDLLTEHVSFGDCKLQFGVDPCA